MKRVAVLTAVIAVFLSLTLQGCFFVAGAAAGAAGVTVVYDHRKIEKILQDENIVHRATLKLQANETISENSHIEVNSFNQIVLLTGETATPEMREEIEEIIRTVPDVKRIYNQISIRGQASILTQASDGWITAKIKSQMIATKGLQSSSIKVITENGTVYLMGTVSSNQADIAVAIARQVSGVQRVVKVFQYI